MNNWRQEEGITVSKRWTWLKITTSQSVQHFTRSRQSEVFCKNGILQNFAKFTAKLLCQSLFLIKLKADACNFVKKETLAQVFSWKFCKIFKNPVSQRTPPVAASVLSQQEFQRVPSFSYTPKVIFHFPWKLALNAPPILHQPEKICIKPKV